MHNYLITIVMQDGSHGRCYGLFENDWQAIDCMLTDFFDARRISARRLA